MRGDIYQSLKKLPEAESDYTMALQWGNTIFNVYNKRGVVYFLQNKLELALADFRQALKIEPENKQAQENFEMTLKKLSTKDLKPRQLSKIRHQVNILSTL